MNKDTPTNTDASKDKLRDSIVSEIYPRLGGHWTQEQEDSAVKGLKALIDQQVQEARIAEAKFWEYNIIPAVRNKQVEKDVAKRLTHLQTKQEQPHD